MTFLLSILALVAPQTDFVRDGARPEKCEWSAHIREATCSFDAVVWADIPTLSTFRYYSENGQRSATMYSFSLANRARVVSHIRLLLGNPTRGEEGWYNGNGFIQTGTRNGIFWVLIRN